MVNEENVFDARKVIEDALKKFEAGDSGAPFERPVLQVLIKANADDPAEFQRLKVILTNKGVQQRELIASIKREELRLKQNASANAQLSSFSPDKIRELKEQGFVVDPLRGITDIRPNQFAKYVLGILPLRITAGDRFYTFGNGVWKPFTESKLRRFLCQLVENIQPDVFQPKWANSCIDMLKMIAREVKEFDIHKNYINLANGMFNMDTFELEEHDEEFHSSVQNPLSYDPDARCPRFIKFLREIFGGDTEIIKVAQEMMGYCLTSETRAHKMFILDGMGSNGKSVYIDIIQHLCGLQNVSHVSMSEMDNPFSRSELVGKTLNVSSENEFSEKGLNTQYIKAISSGDTIRVDVKHQQGFSYKPICKLLFAMNTLPKIMDTSHGFFRRLIIIPFTKIFKNNADRDLTNKLLLELPGIFNFAIQGLKRLKEQEFQFSDAKALNEAISGYKSDQNPAIQFVSEYVSFGTPDDRLMNATLRDKFLVWCRQNGEIDFASKVARDPRVLWAAFRTALLEQGIPIPKPKTSNGERYWPGLVLLDRAKESIADIFKEDEEENAETVCRSRTIPSPYITVSDEGFQTEEQTDDEEDAAILYDIDCILTRQTPIHSSDNWGWFQDSDEASIHYTYNIANCGSFDYITLR
jgi:putative DNA primase/helicase